MSNGLKTGIVIATAIALLASGIAIGLAVNMSRDHFTDIPGSTFFSSFTNMMHGSGNSGGMMSGGWQNYDLPLMDGASLSLDEALEVAENYIADTWDESLEIAEVMQFDNHFYAQASEKDTGINAFEFLIDPRTGAIQPEPGPNMMWNSKYGMMGGQGMMGSQSMMGGFSNTPATSMLISPDRALEFAQLELDKVLPGTKVDQEVNEFYGYYTIHTLKDGEVIGMLSVHGETGQVWLHTWHGEFVEMTEHSHG